MSPTSEYFVRSRGKTLGPFTAQQLKSQHVRGKIGRFHQISTDGVSWEPAGPLLEQLFPSAQAVPLAPVQARPLEVIPLAVEPRRQPRKMDSRLLAVVISAVTCVLLAGGFGVYLYFNNSNSGSQSTSDNGSGSPTLAELWSGDSGNNSLNEPAMNESVCLIVAGVKLVFDDGSYRETGIPTKVDGDFQLVTSTGTGFQVTQDGYILTNSHVIENYDNARRSDDIKRLETEVEELSKITPTLWVFFNGHMYDARLIHLSGDYDLAILKVDHNSNHFFRLNGSRELKRGDEVYSLGFPAAARMALSEEGLLQQLVRQQAAKRMKDHFNRAGGDFQYTQTDGEIARFYENENKRIYDHGATISSGNSGGPLVDEHAVVYGINTWAAAEGSRFCAQDVTQMRKELTRFIPNLTWED